MTISTRRCGFNNIPNRQAVVMTYILDVGHHGRITHAEAPVDPTTTPAIREHGEKGVFVDDVLPLTQTFHAVLVGLHKPMNP